MNAFFILGVVASVFQLVLLRELAFSLVKNELAFIIAAGFWLLFCSLGSFAGLKKKFAAGRSLPWVLSFSFCLCLCGVHLAKLSAGLDYYETASLAFTFISSSLLVGPVSFFVGYAFSVFSQEYLGGRPAEEKTFGHFFAFEALGFLSGGSAFTFLWVRYTNPFVFSILPVLFLFSGAVPPRSRKVTAGLIICLSLIFAALFPFIRGKEFQGARIISARGSGYGPVIIAGKAGVESLYVSGALAATSEDKAFNEEFIHTSLSAAPGAATVLLIGPAFSGQSEEILAHPVERLDVVHLNPALFGKSSQSGRRRFLVSDPRYYLRSSGLSYDCIMMALPPPSALSLNRYYTREFFTLVREHLAEGGVFSFSLPSKRDILSPHIARFDSCIVNTLRSVFDSVLLVPGDAMMLISSSGRPVRPEEMVRTFEAAKIKTVFFTSYHLRDLLDPGRRQYVSEMLDPEIRLNLDMAPRGFLYYLFLEQARFYPELTVNVARARIKIVAFFIAALALLAGLSLLSRSRALLLNAFAIGFCSIGMSAVLWILFQIYSGALFWKMGLILGVFMAGLSAGTFWMNALLARSPYSRRMLSWFFCAWCSFILSLWLFVRFIPAAVSWEALFYCYSFLAGMLTGGMYPLISWCMVLSGREARTIAPSLYSADLAGACAGNLCFSLLFIPFLGIYGSMAVLLSISLLLSLIYAREGLKIIRSSHLKA